jgi:hypothetical protein
MKRNRRKILANPTNKVRNFKTYILFAICGLMTIGTVFMTIESATNGAEIASMQKKEADLMDKQQQLQQSLVETLSVNSLQEQSSGLGFTKIGNLVYVAGIEGEQTAARLP